MKILVSSIGVILLFVVYIQSQILPLNPYTYIRYPKPSFENKKNKICYTEKGYGISEINLFIGKDGKFYYSKFCNEHVIYVTDFRDFLKKLKVPNESLSADYLMYQNDLQYLNNIYNTYIIPNLVERIPQDLKEGVYELEIRESINIHKLPERFFILKINQQ